MTRGNMNLLFRLLAGYSGNQWTQNLAETSRDPTTFEVVLRYTDPCAGEVSEACRLWRGGLGPRAQPVVCLKKHVSGKIAVRYAIHA